MYKNFKFFASMLDSLTAVPEEQRMRLLRAYVHYGTTHSLEGIEEEWLPAVLAVKPSIDAAEKESARKQQVKKLSNEMKL